MTSSLSEIIPRFSSIIKHIGTLNVNITMISQLLDILAPHYCYGCGEVGTGLCVSCKYNIVSEQSKVCIVCRKLIAGRVCYTCPTTFCETYMVGRRTGVLQQIIDTTKFDSVREAADIQAELLLSALPGISEAVFVPIPTVYPHIRRRGFDHTLRIAQTLARKRQATCQQLLLRRSNSVQHGSSRQQRLQQAAVAFRVGDHVDPDKHYILIDDVTTTGASLVAAARCLRAAGARYVYAAVTAYQAHD